MPTEEQLFREREKIPSYSFIGQVLDDDEHTQIATIQQRNHVGIGDGIEFYEPGFTHVYQTIEQLWDEHDIPIERAPRAMMIVKMKVEHPMKRFDMIEIKIEMEERNKVAIRGDLVLLILRLDDSSLHFESHIGS